LIATAVDLDVKVNQGLSLSGPVRFGSKRDASFNVEKTREKTDGHQIIIRAI
jgi:hypothetical protein